MEEFWYYVINGFVSMFIPVFLIGFVWLRGFFFSIMRVKASGGSKALIRGWNVTGYAWRVGKLSDGWLVYKWGKNNRRLKVSKEDFYQMLKVNVIDIDFDSNTITRRGYVQGTPHDAEKTENYYVRAITAPNLVETKTLVILIMLGLIIAIGIITAGLVFKSYGLLEQLTQTGIQQVGVIG